ncbi:MAG: two-component system response regulator CreB [Gammaproteobacteria bacterium]|nr:two-component system response regulator CreB [Gammaproteobacteria bacterium]
MNILLIEDEPAIADTVVYALESEGYSVDWQNTGELGIKASQETSPDLVILDVGLPDMNGFEVFRQIRVTSQVPVIFLTARNVEVDRVTGLEMGADDYVVKPFSPRELTARVRAVLRRVQSGDRSNRQDKQKIVGPFVVNTLAWSVSFQGVELDLTHHEFGVLTALLNNPGQVFSREQLLAKVWDAPEHRLDRTVDAHVKNIRNKLRLVDSESDPIKTRRGIGYFIQLS